MISANRFSVYALFTMLAWFCSCNSMQKSAQSSNVQILNMEKISFVEMRRLNKKIDIKEVTFLNDFTEILNLYKKLEDSKYSRSYPIPSLVEGETLVVLKPILKKEKYGDLEITNIQKCGDALHIVYTEIRNTEYQTEKVSDPILIVKISEKVKTINLKLKK